MTSKLTRTEDAAEPRQQAEEMAAPRGADQLRAILQTAMDGFWQTDAQGRLLAVNDAYCRMSGYSEAELLAMRVPDLVVTESAEGVASRIRKITAQGQDRFESRHRRKDGTLFDVEASVLFLPDLGGQVVAFLRDINERKQAEEALRQSEARFRQLAETISDVFWSTTPNSQQMLYISPAYEEIWGRSVASLYANPSDWMTAIEPAHQPVVLAALARLAEGEPYDLEYRIRRPDESARWVHDRGFQVRDAGGRVCRTVGAASDITERKRAEAYREMGLEIRQSLDEPGPTRDFVQRVLAVLKRRTGCDAVGIRLQDGDDFPYVTQKGFSEAFLLTENTLVERGADGGVCRDKDGNVRLECTCGLVISGKTDPSHPLFTRGGSFWTNDSFPLLDLPADQDPRHHPHNQCMHHGYASMALVPIRGRDRIVGLIHLNDRRKGCFTLEAVELLEGIAAHISAALMHRQAEDELRESEENYRTLFQEMLEGFALHEIICDEQGNPADYRFLAVNPAFERMTGLRAAAVVGRTVLEALPGTERRWIEAYGKVAITGEPAFFQEYAADLQKHFEVTAFRPAPKQFACIFSDITERKHADEERMRSHELLANLARLVPGVVYQYRLYPDGRSAFPYSSPGMYGIYEVTPEEVREDATPVFGRLHPDDHDRVAATIQESARTLREFYCEFRVTLPSQGLRWRWSQAHPERMDDGGTLWHGIIMDITERKLAVEAGAALEIQLHQAQKLESVGRLAGGVAHDFNNLLMGIMNYVELCQDELAPEHPVRGYLDEIATDAQRSADITKQLLAFARKQVIAPKVLDLNDALTGMLKMLRHLMGEDIAVNWMPGTHLWPVKIDHGQLDQILANLCINARDAIAGVGRVTIETANVTLDQAYCAKHPGTAPGEYVGLAVSDTGCGMSKDVLAHIFEPFYTTKEVGKGTGLGLATVHGIVEQNHGHIEVQSEVSKGTTFRIHLPRATSEADTGPVAVTPERLPRGTETILLAEDEKSVRLTSRLFLEALGYTVLAAETPEEALRLGGAHAGPIHLLITDVIMPGMNGPDLAAFLTGEHPKLRCLFMSGYTADVMLHRGTLKEGMPFLPKPFSRDDLARKVREVLDGD